jgi:hypothetical protein
MMTGCPLMQILLAVFVDVVLYNRWRGREGIGKVVVQLRHPVTACGFLSRADP